MKVIHELRIEKIAMGGMGLGFNEGKAIFVPYGAIGDLVDVELSLQKKDHAFARVLHYHERGEGVIDPGCEAFGEPNACGGCDWLMLDYPTQLKYKDALVQDLFKQYLPDTEIYTTVASPSAHNYRNKVFMPVGKEHYGIYARYSHEIIPHKVCRNHPPIFDRLAAKLLELCQKAKVEAYNEQEHTGTLRHIGFRCNRDQSQILVIMVTRTSRLPFSNTIVRGLSEEFPQIVGIIQNINRERTNVILGKDEKLLFGQKHLEDMLSDLNFNIHYRSFWQVNQGSMENILAAIRAKLKPRSHVIDAYCGIGAIGLSLAASIESIVGIEELSEAVHNARENCTINGIGNAQFMIGKTEQLLPDLLKNQNADCIILDPPRGGVEESALWSIRSAGIKDILYLSCSPMSLARDLKVLLSDAKYTLHSISPFDMFPNTWHIEILAHLKLQK